VHTDATALGLPWAIPFVGLLLTLALCPPIFPSFWISNYGKIILFWVLTTIAPLVACFGLDATLYQILNLLIGNYIPFIILISTLFAIAGGIHIDLNFRGAPNQNVILLACGAFLASIVGTTGASMLLIRPLIRANSSRAHKSHVIIFFIFVVANIGGGLSPLGDPPLFLGFLRGVHFWWPLLNLWLPFLVTLAIIFLIFYAYDCARYYNERENGSDCQPFKISISGKVNLLLLALLIATVMLAKILIPDSNNYIYFQDLKGSTVAISIILLGILLLSILSTPKYIYEDNQFEWAPMTEVAKVFAGIFVTIMPVLAMLRVGPQGAFAEVLSLLHTPDGQPNAAMYFWLSGGLSSFLDNAPTYLVFFNAAGGDSKLLMENESLTLVAMSAGAVFMGANSYIGNAPNLMIKAVAEHHGIKMPSFIGYLGCSVLVLMPTFYFLSWLFFAR